MTKINKILGIDIFKRKKNTDIDILRFRVNKIEYIAY